ncbi:hypothetical protein [Streptomyces sp. NPDC059761]|uniref:hypothetical protein n=1 Tax=Streptomyces sp. NPDC059761 TaxID=3346937 RepID=UPI00365613E4
MCVPSASTRHEENTTMDRETLNHLREHRTSTAQTLTVLRTGRGNGTPAFTAIECDVVKLQDSWELLWNFANNPDKTPVPRPGQVDPRVATWVRTQYDERVVSLRHIVVRRTNSNPDDAVFLRAEAGTLQAVRDLYRLVCFTQGHLDPEPFSDGTPSWYTP